MKTDNELIAEFMGWQRRPALFDIYWKEGEHHDKKSNQFFYNNSWDQLMPVVENISEPHIKDNKIIRSGANVTIMYKACNIHYDPDEDFEDREEHEIQKQGETKIEAVYKAVVEFIKWYNSQSK